MRSPSFTNKLHKLLWLLGLFEYKCSRSNKQTRSYSTILERATKVIYEKRLYLNESISMKGISRETGTNRTYLSRAFNEIGLSYYEYMNKLRVSTAKSIIEKSVSNKKQISIEDLAVMSGFGSSRALVRHFKIETGTTPSSYYKYLSVKDIATPPRSHLDED